MKMISKYPFNINYPLKIFRKEKVNFEDSNLREQLFRRNIYYYKYGNEKNILVEKRVKKYLQLKDKLINYLQIKYPSFKLLSISIFGSSLFSESPGDYDFLVIIEGNAFLLEEITFNLSDNEKYEVNVSIKGTENFEKGYIDKSADTSSDKQLEIINRTAVALFRRHLPIWGYDFINNENEFLKNIHAQASDLLCNTQIKYIDENEKYPLSQAQKSRKILHRTYESICYLERLDNNFEIKNLKKELYNSLQRINDFDKSLYLYKKAISFYKKKKLSEGIF